MFYCYQQNILLINSIKSVYFTMQNHPEPFQFPELQLQSKNSQPLFTSNQSIVFIHGVSSIPCQGSPNSKPQQHLSLPSNSIGNSPNQYRQSTNQSTVDLDGFNKLEKMRGLQKSLSEIISEYGKKCERLIDVDCQLLHTQNELGIQSSVDKRQGLKQSSSTNKTSDKKGQSWQKSHSKLELALNSSISGNKGSLAENQNNDQNVFSLYNAKIPNIYAQSTNNIEDTNLSLSNILLQILATANLLYRSDYLIFSMLLHKLTYLVLHQSNASFIVRYKDMLCNWSECSESECNDEFVMLIGSSNLHDISRAIYIQSEKNLNKLLKKGEKERPNENRTAERLMFQILRGVLITSHLQARMKKQKKKHQHVIRETKKFSNSNLKILLRSYREMIVDWQNTKKLYNKGLYRA